MGKEGEDEVEEGLGLFDVGMEWNVIWEGRVATWRTWRAIATSSEICLVYRDGKART